jgi:hypothetical protein
VAVCLFRRERQYDAWHGRREDTESLANLLVTRGEAPAKQLAREAFEAWVARAYDEALAHARRDLGLPAEGAIPAERRDDYDRRAALIDQDRAQRRRNIEDQLRGSMTSFSYVTRGGRTQISTSPDLYRQIPVGALSAIMTLNVTYPLPRASRSPFARSRTYFSIWRW